MTTDPATSLSIEVNATTASDDSRSEAYAPDAAVLAMYTPERLQQIMRAKEATAEKIPDEFWDARLAHRHIRQAAHSRQRSAAAVLHAVLARIAASIPYTLSLPAIVGARAGLSYFGVLLGSPGTGKSSANGIAAELLPFSPFDCVAELTQGTGEGFAEALFEWVEVETVETKASGQPKTTRVKQQTRHNAFIYIDEGEQLLSTERRDGATALSTLRSIWSGGIVGQTNASAERRREVPALSYVFGVVLGLQDSTCGPLLEGVGSGTPQRFGWARATDPTIPLVLPEWPGPLDWQPPAPGPSWEGGYAVALNGERAEMSVGPAICDELRAADRAQATGMAAPDPLRAHGGLFRLKVAALLALLDRRLDVTVDDWHLAGLVKASSDAVRSGVVSRIKQEAKLREAETAERAARRAVITDEKLQEAKTRRRTIDCARKVGFKVWDEPNRWTRHTLRSDMRRYRDVFDEALTHGEDEQWFFVEEERGQGEKKKRIRPGARKPS